MTGPRLHRVYWPTWLMAICCTLLACNRSSISKVSPDPSVSPVPASGTNGGSTSPPAAEVTGLASRVSGDSVAVNVGGDGAKAYRYKIGLKSETDCGADADYSDAASTEDQLVIDLSGLSDGTLILCILTQSDSGTWQPTEDATEFEFERDTQAPVVSFPESIVTSNNAVTLTPNLGDADTAKWEQTSGPGTVTFSSATAMSPTASADIDGDYTIKVTAKDAAGNATVATVTLRWDTTPPPALGGFTGITGSGWRQIDLSLTLPGDVSDYSVINITRSAPSATTGVAAPGCGSGVAVTTQIDFSASPITYTDNTPQGTQYYSYSACILDAAGNLRSHDLTDVQSDAETVGHRHYLAADYDGTGTLSGDIGSDNGTTWSDLTATFDATLNNFNFGSATSGWDGNGTPSDPYTLKFDGLDDTVSAGARDWRSYSIWFKPHDRSSTGTLMSKENGRTFLTIQPDTILFRWYSASGLENRYIPYDGTDWTHLVLSAHGTEGLHVYLNGAFIMPTDTAISDASSGLHFGFHQPDGDKYFDGEIAEFKSFSGSLNGDEVRHMYEQGISRVQPDPGLLTIDHISGLAGRSDGTSEVLIRGRNLEGTTSVRFGNTNATSVEVINDTWLRVQPPAGTAADISITDGTTTLSYPGIYRQYNLTVLPAYTFEPGNIDRLGETASGSNQTSWQSLNNGAEAMLRNIATSYDSVAGSGWTGTGTTASPYRLELDGVDDRVLVGNVGMFRGLAMWFKAQTIDGTIRYIFHGDDLGDTFAYVANNTLYCRYSSSDGADTRSVAVANDEWHHVAVFHDGTDAYCYLDGAEFGSRVGAPAAFGRSIFRIGNNDGDFDNSFDGEIGQIMIFNLDVSTTDIETLYNATKSRYPAP